MYMNKKIIIKKETLKRTVVIPPHLLKMTPTTVLNKLYLNISFQGETYAQKIIQHKLNSYMTQDKKKNRYDSQKRIIYEQLLEKMVASKMKCCYCRCKVFLFYMIKREPLQWTLDRIDNDKGHNGNNVVIACLKCNIERRRRDSQKFLFGKQMKIIKLEDERFSR